MFWFGNNEKLDEIVASRWPGDWSLTLISTHDAMSAGAFSNLAQELARRAKKLNFPVLIGVAVGSKTNSAAGSLWNGKVMLGSPSKLCLEMLMTKAELHENQRMGRFNWGTAPESCTVDGLVKSFRQTGRIWRCNFKLIPLTKCASSRTAHPA